MDGSVALMGEMKHRAAARGGDARVGTPRVPAERHAGIIFPAARRLTRDSGFHRLARAEGICFTAMDGRPNERTRRWVSELSVRTLAAPEDAWDLGPLAVLFQDEAEARSVVGRACRQLAEGRGLTLESPLEAVGSDGLSVLLSVLELCAVLHARHRDARHGLIEQLLVRSLDGARELSLFSVVDDPR